MATETILPAPQKVTTLKCLIWDLDDTLWEGTLAEGDNVKLRSGVAEIIQELDARGILQSVASRNDSEPAMAALKRLGLAEYFLHPQIGWSEKSASVTRVAKLLDIAVDRIGFIDDQPFERDEVRFVHPEVICFDSKDLKNLLTHSALVPEILTEESRSRRLLYLTDLRRREDEQRFEGCREAFLASLGMKIVISRATLADLERAAELTARTSQLNTTGYVFSPDELRYFSSSPDYLVYVVRLEDKYGTYGTIGLAVAELTRDAMCIKLLLMSCRVLSRGVGTVVLAYLINTAKERGVEMHAKFIPSDRNRIMDVTLRFAGFTDFAKHDGHVILRHPLDSVPAYPSYISVE